MGNKIYNPIAVLARSARSVQWLHLAFACREALPQRWIWKKKLTSGEIDHTNADLRQYLTIENGDLTIENEDSKKENDRSTIPINPLYLWTNRISLRPKAEQSTVVQCKALPRIIHKKQVQIQGCSSSRSGRWQWVFWCSAKPCHKHLNLFTGLCGPGASKTFNEGSSCIPATTHPIQHSPLVFAVFCENTCDKHKKRAFANVDGGNSFPACPDQILCQSWRSRKKIHMWGCVYPWWTSK